MCPAQVVKMSVANDIPFQASSHPDDYFKISKILFLLNFITVFDLHQESDKLREGGKGG